MKVINLNESQYKRLFEMDSFVAGASDANLDKTPQNLTNDEIYTDAVTVTPDGDENFVDAGGSEIEKKNRFAGANRKQDPMSADGPWQRPGRIGGY